MYELDKEQIDDVAEYLKENLDCYLMLFEWNVLGVILPATISYIIESTVPGIKWNRAQSGTKPATIETGLEIQVPLHKNEGDTVILNTLTGETS
jgi:elongation factor P